MQSSFSTSPMLFDKSRQSFSQVFASIKMWRRSFLTISFFAFFTVALGVNYPVSNNPNDVKFILFPNNGNPATQQELVYNNPQSVINSAMNFKTKTVFLIHGFTDNVTVHLDAVVIPAYLASNLNYNYIAVDWSLLSGNKNLPFANDVEELAVYTQVVSSSIPIVANRTAQFIQFLGVNSSLVHIVGHSLGAHTSGNVGQNYQTLTGEKLARITGLDPAGPLFFSSFPFPKINKNNAAFVDIIHTDEGDNGDISVDGDADFYPNDGIASQPGCNLTTDLNNACSHQYAPKIYAASITKNFPSCQCISEDLINGVVSLLTGSALDACLGNCPGGSVPLGENCPTSANGLYSLKTTIGNP